MTITFDDAEKLFQLRNYLTIFRSAIASILPQLAKAGASLTNRTFP